MQETNVGYLRSETIDIAKGIGILSVVAGHVYLENFILINMIYSFHMPLFFYIGGILYKQQIFNHMLLKQARYLKIFLLYSIFFIVIGWLRHREINISDLINLIKSNPLSLYAIPWIGVMWFILSYSIVGFVAHFKHMRNLFLGFTLFFFAFYVNKTYDNDLLYLPLCIGPALMLYVFFLIGLKHNDIMMFLSRISVYSLLIGYVIMNLLAIFILDGRNIKLYNYGNMSLVINPILALIIGFNGIMLTMKISQKIKSISLLSNIFSFIGKFSLQIFIWHLFVITVYKILIHMMGNTEINKFFQYLFTIGIILLSLIMIERFKQMKVKVL